MVMSSIEVHKAHCFMVVQPENEFMGCKYGRDEDCPMKKEYPYITELRDKFADILELFEQCDVYNPELDKGCGYDEERWYCKHHLDMLDRMVKVAQEKLY